jgi:hypothetical protein
MLAGEGDGRGKSMEDHDVASPGGASTGSTRAGAIVMLAGGLLFLAGLLFLPLVEDRSLWTIQWRSGPYWVRELALYILPPVLVVGVAVMGLVAVRLAQAAGGAAIGLGLMPLAEWVWIQIDETGDVDWSAGWWALVLGAALSLVGGVILVVTTERQIASMGASIRMRP